MLLKNITKDISYCWLLHAVHYETISVATLSYLMFINNVTMTTSWQNSHMVLRIKFPMEHTFRIFSIVRINGMKLFCKLIYGTTLVPYSIFCLSIHRSQSCTQLRPLGEVKWYWAETYPHLTPTNIVLYRWGFSHRKKFRGLNKQWQKLHCKLQPNQHGTCTDTASRQMTLVFIITTIITKSV